VKKYEKKGLQNNEFFESMKNRRDLNGDEKNDFN